MMVVVMMVRVVRVVVMMEKRPLLGDLAQD
jgi:hypothetical protein